MPNHDCHLVAWPWGLSYAWRVRPSREQLDLLSRTERLNFEVADLFSREPFVPAANAYLTVAIGGLIWSCGGRRMRVHGLENIAHLGKRDRVLLVANHRSYFDFFAVLAATYWHTNLTKKFFCPIRSTFFYDHPLGPVLNMSMSMMRMFPPILRGENVAPFNQFAIDRCAVELRKPGTLVCIHPEGTRSRGDDPYAFLPPKPGAGFVALAVPEAHVVPVFTLGITNDLPAEFRKNWLAPDGHPIDVYFGPPMQLGDLRALPDRPTAAKTAADRIMEQIARLGAKHRRAQISKNKSP